jgi:hypothetical protein
MKSKCPQNLGGWYRLFIVVSIIYLFIVIFSAIFLYHPPAETHKIKRINKTIELVDKWIKNKQIDDSLIVLQNYLNKKNTEPSETEILNSRGISVQEVKDEIIVTLKNGDRISFPKKLDSNTIIAELDNHLKKETKKQNDWTVANKIPLDIFDEEINLSDEEIISKIHFKYKDQLNFSQIESEYIKERIKYRDKKRKYIYYFIVYTFAFWFIPVIVLYSLGISVGWVVKGFQKS